MTDHKDSRSHLLGDLRYELVGPWEPWDETDRLVLAPGSERDFTGDVVFTNREEAYGPFVQRGTHEEVLQRDRPCKRYGVGVLYPLGVPLESDPDLAADTVRTTVAEELDEESPVETLTVAAERGLQTTVERPRPAEADDDDFDLTGANEYRPSTMAISFRAKFPEGSALVVTARGGRYHRKRVRIEGRERTWWLRGSVGVTATFEAAALLPNRNSLVWARPQNLAGTNTDDLPIDITVFTRPTTDRQSLLTVSLINRSSPPAVGGADEVCLFQARFAVQVVMAGKQLPNICPYPERPTEEGGTSGEEDASFDLLYRKMKTFAIGHGCAADWTGPAETSVTQVRAEPLPVVETPSITPQIYVPPVGKGRREVTIPMAPLAGLDKTDDGFSAMEEVINLYEKWLNEEQRPAAGLN